MNVGNHANKVAILAVLMAGLGLTLASRVAAQTFTVLHSFDTNSANGDGTGPFGRLVLSGNTLYGTTEQGGSAGVGTVFKVNTNGTGFSVLHSFTATDSLHRNSDGAYPNCELNLSGSTLYGTTGGGGSPGNGALFKVNTDSTGFTNLYNFASSRTNDSGFYTNSDGASPSGALVLSGSTLYGTTGEGGSSGNGSVFAVKTDGTGFTSLYTFAVGSLNESGLYTNSDGAVAVGGLILSRDTLYGVAQAGGIFHNGTVFKINTNGTDFTVLHSFTAGAYFYISGNAILTNSDGAFPWAGLILSGNTLYGTTYFGGTSGRGTVFKVNTDGKGFATVHDFTPTSANSSGVFTNSDGTKPQAELILSDNSLYGTTSEGGNSGNGTIFAVNTDGTGFVTLHNFGRATFNFGVRTNSDGANPSAGLILSDNTLYGTAWLGGSSGFGTVFRITLPPPQLTIIPSPANFTLTWPTNAAGFTLQSTTNLVSQVWTTNSPAPVVVNGQYTVTNPISGTQKFYRLSQ